MKNSWQKSHDWHPTAFRPHQYPQLEPCSMCPVPGAPFDPVALANAQPVFHVLVNVLNEPQHRGERPHLMGCRTCIGPKYASGQCACKLVYLILCSKCPLNEKATLLASTISQRKPRNIEMATSELYSSCWGSACQSSSSSRPWSCFQEQKKSLRCWQVINIGFLQPPQNSGVSLSL